MPLLDAMKQILDTVTETTRDVEAVEEEVGNLLKTILENIIREPQMLMIFNDIYGD